MHDCNDSKALTELFLICLQRYISVYFVSHSFKNNHHFIDLCFKNIENIEVTELGHSVKNWGNIYGYHKVFHETFRR